MEKKHIVKKEDDGVLKMENDEQKKERELIEKACNGREKRLQAKEGIL